MPAVQDLLSTINQYALARLPVVGSWRASSFDSSRSFLTGRAIVPVGPEEADLPESEYAHAGPEPLLDEVLCDPVVQLVMRADGVNVADLQSLLDTAQRDDVMPTERAVTGAR
jgi:hypothetical protein